MKKTIEEYKNQKNELGSIIFYSVILGISVNIISGILSDLFKISIWKNLIIWVAISIVIILTSQIIKLHKLKSKIKFNCLFITDASQKNEMISIPNYEISEDMERYFEAACSENQAFRTIWENAGLDKSKGIKNLGKTSESKELLIELVEYCILERFSIFISDYYNMRNITKKTISYSGNDIPDVLLKNRFLKLFSEDPKNRAAFCGETQAGIYMIDDRENESEDEGTVVYLTGSNGAIYRRFELNIPKGSVVFRENNNTIVVDTKLFTLKYKVVFDGFNTVVEYDFYKYYLHKKPNIICQNWKYNIEVDVKYKYSSLLKVWNWKYYNWLDEYLVKLLNYCDIDTFYKNIGWEKSKTFLRILKSHKQ